jgi:hypothetical protein
VAHAAAVAAQSIQNYVDHPTNSAAASLAGQEVKALSAAVGAASACGGALPGYERGLLGSRLGPKIRDLLDRVAANHAMLEPLVVETVLEAAVEVGASRPQLQTLVAAMQDLIGRPPLNTDATDLRTILFSASRYNLPDLAAAAQGALAALGGGIS